MKASTKRPILRIVHLVAVIPVLGYVYQPIAEAEQYQRFVDRNRPRSRFDEKTLSGGASKIAGYYAVWAAIWTPFSISVSCGVPVNWAMTYTNGTTGAVDFARSSSTQYMSSGTIDEDWAAFSTAYTVSLTVTDNTGAVLDSRTAVVTTKQPKSSGA